MVTMQQSLTKSQFGVRIPTMSSLIAENAEEYQEDDIQMKRWIDKAIHMYPADSFGGENK